MVWLILLLVLSIGLNALFIWYIRFAIKKLLFVSDNIGQFLEKLDEYRYHLETINAMESYYGDELIENLLKHTKAIVKEIKAYEGIYSLTSDIEIESEENLEEEKMNE